MSTPLRSEALLNELLRRDFSSFIEAAFSIISPGDDFLPNWHIQAVAHALLAVLEGKVKRLIITMPPRSLKSICTSVAFPAYVLGRDPTRRIICVSYSEQLARKHANDCRALMRSRRYRAVFPDARINSAKDSETEFETSERGYRLATSTEGTLTGRGGNLIIIDDPIKTQDAHSEAARERVKTWFKGTLSTRLDNKANDSIIVVMQRLHVDDLVGHLLEQGGWHHLNLPAIAETDEQIPIGPGQLYFRKVGDLLHPEREPQHELDMLRQTMGSPDFSAQYQQQPIPDGGNYIKWSWFRSYDQPPEIHPSDRLIVSWDTAMSRHELADYSVGLVLQVKGESVYVLDVVRERLEYPQLKRRVIATHDRFKSLVADYSLIIEDKGSGMSLIQDLGYEHVHAISIKPEGDKIMRMAAQSALIEAGAVHLPRRAPWLDEFRREFMAFPAGRHNDQVDALSQALAYFRYANSRRIRTGLLAGDY